MDDLLDLMTDATPIRPRYNPSQMVPGRVVTWTIRVDNRDIGQRSGEIWSEGPMPSSWWVTPEITETDGCKAEMPGTLYDDSPCVLIRRARKGNRFGYDEGELFQVAYDWRKNIRRAEHVRRYGVYATPDIEFYAMLHSGDCPEADGEPRIAWEEHTVKLTDPVTGQTVASHETFTAWDVADVLIGRKDHPDDMPAFCEMCIMDA